MGVQGGTAPPPTPPVRGVPPPAPNNNSMWLIGVVVALPLGLILVLIVPGLMAAPPHHTAPQATLQLSQGAWSGTRISFTVTSISTSSIAVANLSFQVVDPNGTLYFAGAAGAGDPVGGFVTTVTCADTSGDGILRAGDSVSVSVDDPSGVSQLVGGRLKLLSGGDVLGVATFP